MSKLEANKNIGMKHNVTLRVLDADTGRVVQEHEGHNMATNSMLTGIGHYLIGDGVLNQGWEMLSKYIPRYISLGTMGLINQDADSNGLPAGIGAGVVTVPQELIDEYNAAKAALELAQAEYDTIICCNCPYTGDEGEEIVWEVKGI